MVYIRTVGYQSAVKRNEVLLHATTWKTLKNILLCERWQATRNHTGTIHLLEMSRKGNVIVTPGAGGEVNNKTGTKDLIWGIKVL